jgi:cell shape-determining protein MreD
MQIAAYLIFGLLLLAFQTAVLSELPPAFSFYDLLVPFVIYFSLFRTFSAGLAMALLLGLAADMLSVSPNGMYMVVYMMTFLLFRHTAVYFQAGEALLFTFATALGVGLEILFFLACLLFQDPSAPLSVGNLQILAAQIIWVFITAPFVYHLLAFCFSRLDRMNISLEGKP